MSSSEPPDVVRALVVAGDVEIPYVATGRGPAVVLLTGATVVRSAFLRGLPRRVRLLIPAAPPPADAVEGTAELVSLAEQTPHDAGGGARWLDDFLDALGLERVWLVADAAHVAEVRAYSAASPERVRGIAELDPLGNDPSRVWDDLAAVITLVDHEDGPSPASIDTRRPRPNVRE